MFVVEKFPPLILSTYLHFFKNNEVKTSAKKEQVASSWNLHRNSEFFYHLIILYKLIPAGKK